MNSDQADLMLAELRQMRQLLELMAEPAIAQRDATLRRALLDIVGVSPRKQQSVMLMDGSRTQAQIITQTSVNQGDLSNLVGKLDEGGLLLDGRKKPKLVISIPSTYFDANPDTKRR